MAGFEYLQASEIRDAFARHDVRYLFLGKSGAILLGYPDTTQDADIFPEKSVDNGRALAEALRELGFPLSEEEAAQVVRGKDFVQSKNGPFDRWNVYAPFVITGCSNVNLGRAGSKPISSSESVRRSLTG